MLILITKHSELAEENCAFLSANPCLAVSQLTHIQPNASQRTAFLDVLLHGSTVQPASQPDRLRCSPFLFLANQSASLCITLIYLTPRQSSVNNRKRSVNNSRTCSVISCQKFQKLKSSSCSIPVELEFMCRTFQRISVHEFLPRDAGMRYYLPQPGKLKHSFSQPAMAFMSVEQLCFVLPVSDALNLRQHLLFWKPHLFLRNDIVWQFFYLLLFLFQKQSVCSRIIYGDDLAPFDITLLGSL